MEKKKKYNKEYYSDKARGKKHRKYCKTYYTKNKEKLIEKQQNYYKNNIGSYMDYHKKYYLKHRARLLRYQKSYSKIQDKKKTSKKKVKK